MQRYLDWKRAGARMPARSSGRAAQSLTVRPRLLVLATHRREGRARSRLWGYLGCQRDRAGRVIVSICRYSEMLIQYGGHLQIRIV
jgi:hypothetical protein